jgi:hypothetical protein
MKVMLIELNATVANKRAKVYVETANRTRAYSPVDTAEFIEYEVCVHARVVHLTLQSLAYVQVSTHGLNTLRAYDSFGRACQAWCRRSPIRIEPCNATIDVRADDTLSYTHSALARRFLDVDMSEHVEKYV